MTACKKDGGTFSTPSDNNVNTNTIKISGTEANVKLIRLEGFEEPCFNILLDAVWQGLFRFTGGYGYTIWNHQNLSPGINTISFTCMHEFENDSEKGVLIFEINDGVSKKSVTAYKTSHCKYGFGILLNNQDMISK